MKRSLLVILASALILASCDKTGSIHLPSLTQQTEERIAELTSSGELSTTEYTVEKIIKASDCAWWKIGDRKILFRCRAYIEAGIDMSRYDASLTEIDEDKKSITLTLPPVKLLSLRMPAEDVKLQYQKVSATRFKFTAEERNRLLRQGEADIRACMFKMGILEDAEANATTFFTSMLSKMGYETITIKYQTK